MSKYKKFTQLEHVLARPDTYIGSVERDHDKHWVIKTSNQSGDDSNVSMIQKQLSIIPGLYKIFDEIVVNAIDQCQVDTTVDSIRIDVNKEEGYISVLNTGTGIPVQIHDEYKIYIPELIFGELLTSENYDDSVKRTTGGRNGYGAKLANIFSTKFMVETLDIASGKKYSQTWSNNMREKSLPSITSSAAKKGYAKFTFWPDFARFNMESLEQDMIDLFQKRAYDVCACTKSNISVFYNSKQLSVKTFEKYIDLYIGSKTENPRVCISNSRWDVAVCASSDSYKQVSFVNGISTSQGGQHVDYVLKTIINKLNEYISTQPKYKNLDIKSQYIKDHMFVFVKSTLENPTFSSQTKTECTSKWGTFGSKPDINEEFIKKIIKLGILDEAVALAKHKELRELSKTDGKKRCSVKGIPKLEDANKAGTNQSSKCTLILTEGDSAKTFAISGLSVVGRDHWGVFPLRGKLLNVREANPKQLLANAEIIAIKQILGLQQGKEYKNVSELRYSRIMVLTDADVDGSHIKGLIFNFIGFFWPSLLKTDLLCSLITPIIKASKGSNIQSFYTLPEYKLWSENTNTAGWNIKYYKGLGTSTATEAKDYFKNLARNTVRYDWEEKTDESLILAFQKDHADHRKQWILDGIQRSETLDNKIQTVPFIDFINKDLIWFSIADITRSIPSMVDGLKPSQRKVLYACRKKTDKETKVSQLAGYIGTETCYHHGEASLMGTIITMAQNYVGSNNMNLLEPKGQFGTRYMGGKDAASPRYIFTNLSNNAKTLFVKDDDQILDYLDDDGVKIEPSYFVPVLPLVLINGCEGIGTGYSTSVPCFNPEDIKNNITNILKNRPFVKMKPWYSGFKGTITESDKDVNRFTTKGIWKMVNATTIDITELPIGRWTQGYKEHLDSLEDSNIIESYENHSNDTNVRFRVRLSLSTYKDLVQNNGEKLEKIFKLTSDLTTTNMHLFDENNCIKKYTTIEDIVRSFVKVRYAYYQKRKKHILGQMTSSLSIIDAKIKFLGLVITDKIVVFKRKKAQIIDDIVKHDIPKCNDSYDYLLNMKLSSLCDESITELQNKQKGLSKSFDDLKSKTENLLWLEDIESVN